jgi:hypothetical protein
MERDVQVLREMNGRNRLIRLEGPAYPVGRFRILNFETRELSYIGTPVVRASKTPPWPQWVKNQPVACVQGI